MGARLVHLLLALGFAGALALATSTGTAYACDCAIGEPQDYLARADVAFEGTVTAVAVAPAMPGREPALAPVAVSFAVETYLKGAPDGEPASLTLTTENNSGACGVAFSAGERWRIYASLVPGAGLTTHLCAGDELLGMGTVPVPTVSGPPPALLLVIGAAVVVAAVSAWAFTRRSRSAA